MQKTKFKRFLSFFLCIVLIAALALFAAGCNDTTPPADSNTQETNDTVNNDVTVLGEGQTQFTFTVVDGEGKETVFEIHTDKSTVGEALLDLNLIAGEDSTYGLYVKTVNGIFAEYESTGTYWAFYLNGEYAMSGVDSTEITADTVYMLKVERA